MPDHTGRPVPAAGRLRVCLVCLHTSPLESPGAGDAGGMNVHVAEAARRMAALGHDVDVLTRAVPGGPDGPVELPPVGSAEGRARVVPLRVPAAAAVTKDELAAHLPAYAAAALAGPRYDVVHGHYWLSGEIAAVLGTAWHVPWVVTFHTTAAAKAAAGTEPAPPPPGDVPDRETAERWLAATAAAVVAGSRDEAATVRGLGGDPARVVVVPPGVDTDQFRPAAAEQRRAARDRHGLAPDALVVLFVGRLQPHKGIDLLVAAVAEAVRREESLRARLRLVVLGGASGAAPEAGDIAAEAAAHGIAELLVHRERVDRAELAGWYAAADVVVVPSRHETFGLVALEAQAAGVPVLASRAGGLLESVPEGSGGVLVAGRDPGEWATRLAALLDDPRERARLAASGPVHAARFSWAATVGATLEVYRRLVAGRPPGGAPADPRDEALGVVTGWLRENEIEHAPGARPGEVVAVLPGEHKLATTVSLLVGGHSLSASAFVCRRPDDDPGPVHQWLLRRNARLPGVSFAVDAAGDIYLTGRIPLSALRDGDALDDLLGVIADTADGSFDEILVRGFADAIRGEHAWRVARGLPTTNLRAFQRLIGDTPAAPPAAPPA